MKFFVLCFSFLFVGCATSRSLNEVSADYLRAEEAYSLSFPNKYPAREVKLPLESVERTRILNLVKEVSEHLSKAGVKNQILSAELQVQILPQGSHPLNTHAKRLQAISIELKYDGLYFARNPFSAGTFLEKKKVVLISHSAFKNEERLMDVFSHEMVHVNTFDRREKKLPSLFYCRFKGKQFAPHFLSCDEMNAYHHDLKRLRRRGASNKQLSSKLKAARMHTEPIAKLVEDLNFASLQKNDEWIRIDGKNSQGHYYMEFPSFCLEPKKLPKISGKQYARRVAQKSLKLSELFSK